MHKKAVTKQPNSRSTACSSFFGGTQVIWQRNSVPGDVSRHFDGLSSFIIIIFALKWPWHDDGIPWYTPFSDRDIQLQSTHTYPELWTNNAFIYVSSTSGAHHGTEPLIHTTSHNSFFKVGRVTSSHLCAAGVSSSTSLKVKFEKTCASPKEKIRFWVRPRHCL